MFEAWEPQFHAAAWYISIVVISVGAIQTSVYLLQLVVAAYALLERPPVARPTLLWQRYGEIAPPIALIVPAYNESLNAVQTVRSMLSLEYPNFEIIVVNDGSKDDTLQVLIEGFDLVPVSRSYEETLTHKPIRGVYASPTNDRLFVVDKENGGKADAQNAGINVCRAPMFCILDGDSILEPDALIRTAQPFIDDPERTIAVGGTIRIANGSKIEGGRVSEVHLPTNLVALFQVVEYLRAFLMARLAWSRINTLMLVSGAFSVFRRQEAVEVGGFTNGSLGEDLDIVVKLHRHMLDNKRPYRIAFVPEPVCWTEAPESLKILKRQRTRWQRGALEVCFKYRDMLFNPRYGRIGFLGFGHMYVVDVIGPVSEVLGYGLIILFWLLGALTFDHFLAMTALVFVYGVFISVSSLVLEEMELQRFPRARDLLVLTVIAVIENFGYRQLNNLWRIQGYWQYLRGDRGWGEMTRTGLGAKK